MKYNLLFHMQFWVQPTYQNVSIWFGIVVSVSTQEEAIQHYKTIGMMSNWQCSNSRSYHPIDHNALQWHHCFSCGFTGSARCSPGKQTSLHWPVETLHGHGYSVKSMNFIPKRCDFLTHTVHTNFGYAMHTTR